MSVQAYGDATNAPTAPATKQVTLTWLPFTNATASSQYKLLRVAQNQIFDTSASSACTSATTTTCLVCTKTGTASQSCVDTNVALSPQQYDYGIEDSSATSYTPVRIRIPVPPDNMVLVQRDAANYEMCQLLQKISDPFNHQRCDYSGLGAVPYNSNPGNSPLSLPATQYDFGYNLFVDRWQVGCNWSVGTGLNTPCTGAVGNCFGAGAPPGIGTIGSIYYDTTFNACYINVGGAAPWTRSDIATPVQFAAMATLNPGANGGHRPPLGFITQQGAFNTCQTFNVPTYGPKRLLRLREYIAAAAWNWLPNEPAGTLTDAQIGTLEAGDGTGTSHTAGQYYCASDSAAGFVGGNFNVTDYAGDATSTTPIFNIGSLATSKCVSRYGMQDFVGNNANWLSDNLTACSVATHKCFGTTATYDSGNTDLATYNFDGVTGPGGLGGGQNGGSSFTGQCIIENGIVGGTGFAQCYGAGYFSVPLGLLMVGNDSGNAVQSSTWLGNTKFHGDYARIFTDNGNVNRGLQAGTMSNGTTSTGRWGSLNFDPTFTSGNVRCGLPAE